MSPVRLPASPRHRLDRSAFLTNRRLFQLTLLALILLAWGLRLHRLDAQSLWYDEGVTANLAQRTLVDLTQWTARDIQPPLYYYVVWGWGRVAGWSEWSLRFVSVWWGVSAVPLLAVLAYRLTQRHLVALLAALFTTVHPLLLYYSQEARMYTMLVTLGLGAGYLLLRLSETASPPWRQWAIYALVATAAVYTHYFAFFLLLGLGLAFLLHHFVRQPFGVALRDRRLAGFLGTHLAILVVYLAWIGALFRQLTTDASYWQGQLKVWEALRTIALRFTQGETVAEQTAVPGLLLYAGITLLLLLILGGQVRRHDAARKMLLYALCWLAFPIGGVLGLAAFVPKFNARYVLLALPGVLLLWSAGLATLYPSAPWPARKAPFLHLARQIGSVLLLFLLLTGFQEANRNWFTDPAFTKAQWRELAAYLREHWEPDEAILLVSGHAWPVWAYYAPDLPAIRLPDLEILDVNAVLDFANTGAVLQAALQDKAGVWLINWQDEVVDPNGVAARQLLSAATEQPVQAEFWQLRLRHFVDLTPAAIQTTPPIDVVLDANFGDQLRLQGYTVTPEGDLLLFWQLGSAPSAPLPDLHINLRTETAAGLLYADPADRRPADYNFPVMRWQPGQTVMGRISADAWAGAGALPGRYQIHLGVYDPAGDPAGLDLLGRQATGSANLPS
ncbi:MAG: glycosyltransferase family 39 protein [Caldilineaceae bacterium]